MKIGIVCYPTFGGSGVVATELGKALSETGNIVHFISYAQPARLNVFSDNLFYHEVSIKNYPLFDYPPYETSLTSKIVEIVEFEKLGFYQLCVIAFKFEFHNLKSKNVKGKLNLETPLLNSKNEKKNLMWVKR